MKNPNIKILTEIITYAHGRQQSNYEKLEMLSPISKQLDFELDSRRILFHPPFEGGDDEGLEICYDIIYTLYIKGDTLYILCTNGVLFTFGIVDKSWDFMQVFDGISPVEMLIWRCSMWFKKKVRPIVRGIG